VGSYLHNLPWLVLGFILLSKHTFWVRDTCLLPIKLCPHQPTLHLAQGLFVCSLPADRFFCCCDGHVSALTLKLGYKGLPRTKCPNPEFLEICGL